MDLKSTFFVILFKKVFFCFVPALNVLDRAANTDNLTIKGSCVLVRMFNA